MLCGLGIGVGATLVLAELRWFSRRPLVDRLRPYGPAGAHGPLPTRVVSVESFRDVVGPLAREAGERLARGFGVDEDLALRLERVHFPLDPTAFRVRQLGCAVAAFALGTLGTAAIRPPAPIAFGAVLGPPLLAFLLVEQRLATASAAWKQRLSLELPVVAEQLAMLLSAGWSLGTALNRIAARGEGNCARDLARVCGRVRQGLSEAEALREWSAVARVDALDRLVPLLSLGHDTSDLGRLVSEEARAIRRDLHRQLIETVERRGQQVWVPVTVAALLPGVIFVAIPFIEALRLFAAS